MNTFNTQADVAQAIQASEVSTGRAGRFFTTIQNGEFKMVELTIENGFLIADGRELLDMSTVSIMAIEH